jgi:hypothetical protein
VWGQDSCFFAKASFLGGQMILLDHGSVIAELKSDIAIWAVVWWGAEIPSVFRGTISGGF